MSSAYRHGTSQRDIEHALTNYLRVFDDQGEVAMFVGPATGGTVLGIGVVLDEEDPRIIHAMPVRAKYWP